MSECNFDERTILRQVIGLAAVGARGEARELTGLDWRRITEMSVTQNTVTLAGCAIWRAKETDCPAEVRDQLIKSMRNAASANAVRRGQILRLLSEMKKAGIETVVLKGYSAAKHYAYPECRDSIDADVFVSPEREKQACDFLRNKGFRIETRLLTDHRSICVHPLYGEIELHVRLYSELVEDVWFGSAAGEAFVKEPVRPIQTPDGDFTMLGPTDQLIFLALHAVKHFISGGISVRMMLDTALQFSEEKDSIDAGRFWRIMKKFRCAEFLSCMLWIMIGTGAFTGDDFPGLMTENPEQADALTDDLLRGGYMGAEEDDKRFDSKMEFTRHILMQRKGRAGYVLYMIGWKARRAFRVLFPAREEMRDLYPGLKKRPYLMARYRMAHAAKLLTGKVRTGGWIKEIRTDRSRTTKESENRVRLFEKLHMV